MSVKQYNKITMLLIMGLILWFIPHSSEISPEAWHLFVIFVVTILGIILNPMPMGAITILSIAVCSVTKTLSLTQALAGFGSAIVWLVVFAFFISKGFSKTNLGRRMAYFFISKLGHSTLGLSYGLIFTDFLLSPLIPSVTARGGGIVFPIARSLVDEYSKEAGAHSHKTAGFIMKVCFQSNVITSAMFLTAMAANPLIVKIALDNGIVISWAKWALAAIVPGIASLLLLPLIIFMVYPPEIKHSDSAPKIAAAELKRMGALSLHEVIMLFVFILLITLWIIGGNFGIDATTTALLGLSILLLTGVLTWEDAIAEKGAWRTFIWFATLVMLSGALSQYGLISWLGGKIDAIVNREYVVFTMFAALVFYFFIHYFFASATALISTLFATLLVLFISLGIPPLIAAFSVGFTSILSSGLTHFGIASAPIFFGAGYINTQNWWKVGFIVGVFNFILWIVVGGAWWKALGWW